jgi:hypothetical protein
MKKDNENPENSGKIQEGKDEKGRFLPGVSGNPAGKPKGTRHFSTLIGQILKKKIKLKDKNTGEIVETTVDQAMVDAMVREVLKGDVKAFEALTNRHDGKPHQTIDMEVSEPPVPIMPIKKKKP